MSFSVLEESRGHLADLLEAAQRCAFVVSGSTAASAVVIGASPMNL